MDLCMRCGEEKPHSGTLCWFCLLLVGSPAPSVKTVAEHFEDGVEEGKALYLRHGAGLLRGLDSLRPVRGPGVILEPIDLDAVIRGVRAGVLRAHRSSLGLPEACDAPTCGRFGICDACKRWRRTH